jgi:hypothetical protein
MAAADEAPDGDPVRPDRHAQAVTDEVQDPADAAVLEEPGVGHVAESPQQGHEADLVHGRQRDVRGRIDQPEQLEERPVRVEGHRVSVLVVETGEFRVGRVGRVNGREILLRVLGVVRVVVVGPARKQVLARSARRAAAERAARRRSCIAASPDHGAASLPRRPETRCQ